MLNRHAQRFCFDDTLLNLCEVQINLMCIQNAIQNIAAMDKSRNTRDKFDGDFSLGQLFVLRIRSSHLLSA